MRVQFSQMSGYLLRRPEQAQQARDGLKQRIAGCQLASGAREALTPFMALLGKPTTVGRTGRIARNLPADRRGAAIEHQGKSPNA